MSIAIGIENIHYPSEKMSQSPKGGNTTCSITVNILTAILAVTSQSTSMQVGCIFPIIQVHSTLNQSIIRILSNEALVASQQASHSIER